MNWFKLHAQLPRDLSLVVDSIRAKILLASLNIIDSYEFDVLILHFHQFSFSRLFSTFTEHLYCR